MNRFIQSLASFHPEGCHPYFCCFPCVHPRRTISGGRVSSLPLLFQPSSLHVSDRLPVQMIPSNLALSSQLPLPFPPREIAVRPPPSPCQSKGGGGSKGWADFISVGSSIPSSNRSAAKDPNRNMIQRKAPKVQFFSLKGPKFILIGIKNVEPGPMSEYFYKLFLNIRDDVPREESRLKRFRDATLALFCQAILIIL